MIKKLAQWFEQRRFRRWALRQGLSESCVEQLIVVAASPEEMKAAYDAIMPPPPIYPLRSIRAEHESDPMDVAPAKYGFLIVGTCPNGDPIAVDLRDDVGSVWYLAHELMHEAPPLRSIAIRVADDVYDFVDGLAHRDGFPIDYFQAKQS